MKTGIHINFDRFPIKLGMTKARYKQHLLYKAPFVGESKREGEFSSLRKRYLIADSNLEKPVFAHLDHTAVVPQLRYDHVHERQRRQCRRHDPDLGPA